MVKSRIREVMIPGSKSLSHRAAILAALAPGESRIKGFLACEDTNYTLLGLEQLGCRFSIYTDGSLTLQGRGRDLGAPSSKKEIYLGNSGTSLRLLLGVCALARGTQILTGEPRLRERPISDLVQALEQWGAEIEYLDQPGLCPLSITSSSIRGGRVTIDASKSSQFLSSLLIISPLAQDDVEIRVSSGPISQPYVQMTIDLMERFGVTLNHQDYNYFKVPGGQRYAAQEISIEGDVSSASYFWAGAMVTGRGLITRNIYPFKTSQGDIRLLDLLEQMGATVVRQWESVMVQGGVRLQGIEADMGHMPDMVPTLAAIALFAEGSTVIRNVAHLRYKESDRLEAVATEWKRLGARVEELPDGLIIHGNHPLRPAEVDPHNDHRIAMSLAIVALRVRGTTITHKACVSKSFPGFWDLWESTWS